VTGYIPDMIYPPTDGHPDTHPSTNPTANGREWNVALASDT